MKPLSNGPSKTPPPPPPPISAKQPVDTEALGDQIAEISAHIQAATYGLLVLIREFDEREGWGTYGARSCAHWLNWRTGLDLGAAREKVRVARSLGRLPVLSKAMSRGEISYSKVRALSRVATPENESELLEIGRAGTASHVERIVRAWRRLDRMEESRESARQREHRYVQTYTDEDGMLVIRGLLPPEVGAALLQALDSAGDELCRRRQAEDPPPASDEPTVGQKRADAPGSGRGAIARPFRGERQLRRGRLMHRGRQSGYRDRQSGY